MMNTSLPDWLTNGHAHIWLPYTQMKTADLPAPAVLVWASVSKALSSGLGGLPHATRMAAMAGALVGVILTVLERVLPKRALRFVPSPTGLGIAMVMPGSNAVAMFTGAMIAASLSKDFKERSLTPLASGLIAGESLTGITLALLRAAGVSV